MYTAHAKRRMQDRGIRAGFVDDILAHADREVPVGGHCRLLRVSRARAMALNVSDRLGRYGVIWSDATGAIVTVLPIHAGPSGARYRRAR